MRGDAGPDHFPGRNGLAVARVGQAGVGQPVEKIHVLPAQGVGGRVQDQDAIARALEGAAAAGVGVAFQIQGGAHEQGRVGQDGLVRGQHNGGLGGVGRGVGFVGTGGTGERAVMGESAGSGAVGVWNQAGQGRGGARGDHQAQARQVAAGLDQGGAGKFAVLPQKGVRPFGNAQQGAFAHAADQQVGLAVLKNGTAQGVVPEIVMAGPA